MAATRQHGYVPYTRGCRCGICKAAKAKYMRDLRQGRREQARPNQYVNGITHGYAGYQEHMCRCEICTAAKTRQDRDRLARRASEGGAR